MPSLEERAFGHVKAELQMVCRQSLRCRQDTGLCCFLGFKLGIRQNVLSVICIAVVRKAMWVILYIFWHLFFSRILLEFTVAVVNSSWIQLLHIENTNFYKVIFHQVRLWCQENHRLQLLHCPITLYIHVQVIKPSGGYRKKTWQREEVRFMDGSTEHWKLNFIFTIWLSLKLPNLNKVVILTRTTMFP